MSELPHSPSNSDKPEDEGARIYEVDFTQSRDISDDYIDPVELNDEEVVYVFFSQLNHPGANRGSVELGIYVQKLLGGYRAGHMSAREEAWVKRMNAMLLDIDNMPLENVDVLLENDEVLQEIYKALMDTRSQATQMKEERRALLILRELRAYLFVNDIHNPEVNSLWENLIRRLANT